MQTIAYNKYCNIESIQTTNKTNNRGTTDMNIEMRKVEKEELLGNLFEAYKTLTINEFAEMYPDDAKKTDEAVKLVLETSDYDYARYFAFCQNQMIGLAMLERFSKTNVAFELNKKRVFLSGFVLPKFRKIGLGSHLMKLALSDPMRQDADKFRTYAYNQDGRSFLGRFDGKIVEQSSTRCLDLSQIDMELINCWKSMQFEGERKPSVHFFEDVNWNVIQEIIDLSLESGRETLEMDNNDYKINRQSEEKNWKDNLEYWQKTGTKHYCCILRDPSGSLIGYSMCSFNPNDQDKIWQGMTTVWKHLRGNGYGKLLKALILDHIFKNFPMVKKVYTINNDLNAPMVAINHKLGFVEKSYWFSYVVDYQKALLALGVR
jgi:RimJ/RimL family protein N-acetyltransferase